MQNQNRFLKLIYGEPTLQKITEFNVLMVGAGGIGCELIKNLSQAGYKKITIVDIDTIEATNLNRQFYYAKEDIGKSKAETVKKSILKYMPDLQIKVYHANLFEDQFDPVFFQSFDIIFNALDNIPARRYLSQKAIQNRIVMIEAGTGGYNGQTYSMIRFQTQCNDCQPVPVMKTIATCSIRADPLENTHCIVWGKNFFNLLFASPASENVLEDSQFTQFKTHMLEGAPKEKAIELFNLEFNKKSLPTDRIQRTSLSYEDAIQMREFPLETVSSSNLKLIEDERILSIAEHAAHFIQSFVELLTNRKSEIGKLEFEKDDKVIMYFVASATNLRVYNFMEKVHIVRNLSYMSYRKVKQDAGNIVHAIASTNAIVAGLQVTESLKVVNNKLKDLLLIQVSNSYQNKLTPSQLTKQNQSCRVCSNFNIIIKLKTDFNQVTLGDIISLMQKHYFLRNGIYDCYSISLAGKVTQNEIYNEATNYTSKKDQLLCDFQNQQGMNGKFMTFVATTSKNRFTIIIKHEEEKEEKEKQIINGKVNQARIKALEESAPEIIKQQLERFEINQYEQKYNQLKFGFELYGYN